MGDRLECATSTRWSGARCRSGAMRLRHHHPYKGCGGGAAPRAMHHLDCSSDKALNPVQVGSRDATTQSRAILAP